MTKNLALILALLGMLAACGDGDGTNPVNNPGGDTEDTDDSNDDSNDDTDDDDDGSIDSDSRLPPGTSSPTASSDITRYEAQGGEIGDGYVRTVSYDRDSDTFSVDNLGFDGSNVYRRDDVVGSLGPFALYEAAEEITDPLSGNVISQLSPYKALYGVSSSGKSEFAIVRTGAYVDYGFGGWLYTRNGSVTLPTSGQAAYLGDYAGLRDFKNRSGLEYTTADMQVAIDFEDFNDGDAVRGVVFNRKVYNTDGTDITQQILDAIEVQTGVKPSALPTVRFRVQAGVLDQNGEMTGEAFSTVRNSSGVDESFEEGNYYAVLSGNNAREIVGVIVVESDDPRYDGVTARETGGFILAR